MPVAAGQRLGPYEVLDPIGVGGMGAVCRARDSRLGRDVAIKVLPDAIAADPNRLRRFFHEARAVAALNHPNMETEPNVLMGTLGYMAPEQPVLPGSRLPSSSATTVESLL
jgi:serine/threonine protein kinase